MDSEIELYIRVSIDKTDDGHRHAKLARLPGKPEGDDEPECLTFRARYPTQTENDPTTPIQSSHLATMWLYWSIDLPSEKTRKRVYRHLKQNIRKFLRVDEFIRVAIPAYHKSMGFYFILSGSC